MSKYDGLPIEAKSLAMGLDMIYQSMSPSTQQPAPKMYTASQMDEVLEVLQECRDFIDGQIDVVDGDYGVPAPNKAMKLAAQLDAILNRYPVRA